jgi:hypothetical protein
MASQLFALDGQEVVEVDEEPGGRRTVWVVTADPGARACPDRLHPYCPAIPGRHPTAITPGKTRPG